jgi:hypothetical protein
MEITLLLSLRRVVARTALAGNFVTGTPMGVKVRMRGFRSPEATEVAGKTALAEFLEGLSIEESLGA